MTPPDPRTGADDELAGLEAGLDALDASARPRRSPARVLTGQGGPVALAALVTFLGWALLAASDIRPDTLLPGPVTVGHRLVDLTRDGVLTAAVWTTGTRAAWGFVASVAGGTVLGICLVQVPLLRRGLGPLLAGLQSLPSATWVPAAVLWFGAGDAAMYTVVLCGAVPSVAIGLVAGVDQVPPLYRQAGVVLGAGRLASLRFVLLPAALPAYLGGLRQGWAFAWRSLMAAELILAATGAASSLGRLLDAGRRTEDMATILSVIIVTLLLGLVVETLVLSPIEHRVLRARGLGGRTA